MEILCKYLRLIYIWERKAAEYQICCVSWYDSLGRLDEAYCSTSAFVVSTTHETMTAPRKYLLGSA